MIPAQQGYPISGPSMTGYPSLQQNFNPVQAFSNSQNFLQSGTSQEHSLHQGTDPNSPELFKQNLQLVQQNVLQLQEVAKRALDGMYSPVLFSLYHLADFSMQPTRVSDWPHADADRRYVSNLGSADGFQCILFSGSGYPQADAANGI